MNKAPFAASSSPVCALSATEAVREIRAGHMSPLDAVEASIAQIEATDPVINAMPVRCFDRARLAARHLMETHARGAQWPLLCGLPIAVKDNTDVALVPTSGGSPLTAGRVPEISDPVIATLENNGAITIGKSNLSELGGANTTNSLFGATRNPLFPDMTAGGSSGGSAAALAARQVYLGHGNDVGGSLRTPAAFCGVAGLRPTPGLIARKSLADPFDMVFVEGPMARDITDLALMLDAMTGYHPADLMSRQTPASFQMAAARPEAGMRVAISDDLGILPVAANTKAGFHQAIERLSRSAGSRWTETVPDLAGAPKMIRALRGLNYLASWQHRWPGERDSFTAEVAGDIIHGTSLSPADIARAIDHRASLYRRMQAFFELHDVLICPTTQVSPFPVDLRWPGEIDGQTLETYVDWIMITYIWSVMGCPALALPAGTGPDGMPISLQIVGPPRSEARLLAFAAWAEIELGT